MASSVILLASSRGNARDAVEAFRAQGGFEVHMASGSLNRRDFRGMVASFTGWDETTPEREVVAILRSLALDVGARALLPVTTEDWLFAARHHDALRIAHPVAMPSPERIEQVSHKFRFTRLAEEIGLPVPRTMEARPDINPARVIAELGLPILAKPVIGIAGRGIRALETESAVEEFLKSSPSRDVILQEFIPGEDVALTLLAEEGRVFGVMQRRRWFTRRGSAPFSPIVDVEYFHADWLEELGRRFVERLAFSGIADFDLRVDFAQRRAWFLEIDPRLMGTLPSARVFGFNVPWLLAANTMGLLPRGTCFRPSAGHFLSLRSVGQWLWDGEWRKPRRGPIRTNWRAHAAKPLRWAKRLAPFPPRRPVIAPAKATNSIS